MKTRNENLEEINAHTMALEDFINKFKEARPHLGEITVVWAYDIIDAMEKDLTLLQDREKLFEDERAKRQARMFGEKIDKAWDSLQQNGGSFLK